MLREVIGATDPAEAKAGTIRKLYAQSKERNAIHASDSPENAGPGGGDSSSRGRVGGAVARELIVSLTQVPQRFSFAAHAPSRSPGARPWAGRNAGRSCRATDSLFAGLDFALAEPVRVTGRLQPAGEGRFYWRAKLAARVTASCRRCLEPVQVPVETDIEVLFTQGPGRVGRSGFVRALPGRNGS